MLHALLIASLFFLAPARAEEKLSPAVRKALEETEAKIKALKAAGQLPDAPEPSAAASRVPAQAAPAGCVRLPVGGAAIVDTITDDQSPTGVRAAYGLSRYAEKTWLVEGRTSYRKGAGYPVPSEDNKAVDAKYRKLVTDCLNGYEGKLKGKDGKELVLRLTDNPSVPEHRIEIMGSSFRSNSLQYQAGIACPVVLHETLHLLGLADEYQERGKANEPQLDCRPAGPPDSIMASHWQAEMALAPQMAYEIEMCECEKKGMACWELATKSDGLKCPAGSKPVFQKVDMGMRTSLNALNTNERFVLDLGRMKEAGFEAAAKDTILYPAHFRAITEPGCRDVNEAYYGCAINAYRYSKPTPGFDLGDPARGCAPTPNACRWRSFKWLE